MNYRMDYPALEGRPVTEGHAEACREHGHAKHTVDGVDTQMCPRCGEVVSDNTIVYDAKSLDDGMPYRTAELYTDDLAKVVNRMYLLSETTGYQVIAERGDSEWTDAEVWSWNFVPGFGDLRFWVSFPGFEGWIGQDRIRIKL